MRDQFLVYNHESVVVNFLGAMRSKKITYLLDAQI